MDAAQERHLRAQKHNLFWIAVFGAAYWPVVLLPLVFWRRNVADLSSPLRFVPFLAVTFVVPLCAACFFMGRHRRKRLIIGFALYAFCYLCGNGLGLAGGRWYWLHFTMLSFVLCSGMSITLSQASRDGPSAVLLIKVGHWGAALSFLALLLLRAHVGVLIVWDYAMGSYFAWCIWNVSRLRGLNEDAA